MRGLRVRILSFIGRQIILGGWFDILTNHLPWNQLNFALGDRFESIFFVQYLGYYLAVRVRLGEGKEHYVVIVLKADLEYKRVVKEFSLLLQRVDDIFVDTSGTNVNQRGWCLRVRSCGCSIDFLIFFEVWLIKAVN